MSLTSFLRLKDVKDRFIKNIQREIKEATKNKMSA